LRKIVIFLARFWYGSCAENLVFIGFVDVFSIARDKALVKAYLQKQKTTRQGINGWFLRGMSGFLWFYC